MVKKISVKMKISPINNFIKTPLSLLNKENKSLGTNSAVQNPINLNNIPHYKPAFKGDVEKEEIKKSLHELKEYDEILVRKGFAYRAQEILKNGNDNQLKILQGFITNLLYKEYKGEDFDAQIELFLKITNHKVLYNNPTFANSIDTFSQKSDEDIYAQIEFIDKILSDERLSYNQELSEKLAFVIESQTAESVPEKIELIDRITIEPTLINNESFMMHLPDLLYNSPKDNSSKNTQAILLDKLLSFDTFCENDSFINQIYGALSSNISEEQMKNIEVLLDKISSEKCLYSNNKFMHFLPFALLKMSENEESMKYSTKILDMYIQDENLHNSEYLPKYIIHIAENCDTERKFNIAKLFLSKPYLNEKEKFVYDFHYVLKNVTTPEAEDFVTTIFDNECFKDNLATEVSVLLEPAYKAEAQKQKTIILKNILANEELKNSEFVATPSNMYSIINYVETEEQRKLAERIINDKKLQDAINQNGSINGIMCNIHNESFVKVLNKIFDDEKLYSNSTIQTTYFDYCSDEVTPRNEQEEEILNKILGSDELLNKAKIMLYLGGLFTSLRRGRINNLELISPILDKFLSDKKYLDNETIASNVYRTIFHAETQAHVDNIFDFYDFFLSDEKYYNNPIAKREFWTFLPRLGEENIKNILKTVFQNDYLLNYEKENKLQRYTDKYVLLHQIPENLFAVLETPEQEKLANKILTEEGLYKNDLILQSIDEIVRTTETEKEFEQKLEIIDLFLKDKRLYENENSTILGDVLTNDFYSDNEECFNNLKKMLSIILKDKNLIGNKDVLEHIDEILFSSESPTAFENKKYFIKKIFSDDDLKNNPNIINNLGKILTVGYNKSEREFIDGVLNDKEIYNNKLIMDKIHHIMDKYGHDDDKDIIIHRILSTRNINTSEVFMGNIEMILNRTNSLMRRELLNKILDNKKLINDEEFWKGYADFITEVKYGNIGETLKYIKLYNQGEISPLQIGFLLRNKETVSFSNIRYANKIIGSENLSKLSKKEEELAYKFVRLYQKENINELSTDAKRSFLKKLIKANDSLFETEEEFQKMFPLLPKNQTEYCELLPAIVSSIGIETATLNKEKEENFATSLSELSSSLKTLSDNDFNNLTLEQEYTKQEFFNDVYPLLKDLDKNKRQKIYDYFGFEFHNNKKGSIKNEQGKMYSITGYPANLHNGKKLAQIKNEQVKEIIEQIRPLVVKFSENNKIHSNNEKIEFAINEVVKVFPEIRTLIGKQQHSTHDFDIMKHSLKVMQKITQNPKFDTLNDSDKNILLIASLIHDCTKKEGERDSTHAIESAFDCFYIIQKLNLSKDEKVKLYSLVKHHEWLGDINKTDECKQAEKIKSIAYDLHYGNLFEMAKIFTEADLKAVKNNDDFFNRYQKDFARISMEIEKLITELKTSQPLLPITPLPSSSRIKEAITTVNEDYSTNLKGIYQDGNGMIIIKFNEVENETWGKIGFPKGSISKGIIAKDSDDKEINTGNIKFFVHGLDTKDNLRRFDAFSLPDSDALLSVSYAERPESKYRFYRSQGVIVNTDSKYIHGGGKTDSGSGNNKNIDEFKKNYAYEGSRRYKDRIFISELIKEDLGLSDNQYQELVQKNINRPITEIEPKEYQEAIVKSLATINSHTRYGNRSYNEMYVSNPEVMGVFAYDKDDYPQKIRFFMSQQKDFLKEYAIEKDIPFIIFGR